MWEATLTASPYTEEEKLTTESQRSRSFIILCVLCASVVNVFFGYINSTGGVISPAMAAAMAATGEAR